MSRSGIASPIARVVFSLVALAFILFGVRAMFKNPGWVYPNYRGEMVYGPFAIIIGLLLIYVFAFKPEALERSRRPRKRHFRSPK